MNGMRVRVLFFGQLKDIVGLEQDEAELSDGARVEDLFERYGRRFPKLAEFRPSIAASVMERPCSRSCSANSTMRIEFFAERPISREC